MADSDLSEDALTIGDAKSWKKKFGEGDHCFGDGSSACSQKGWVEEDDGTAPTYTEES